MHSCLSFSDRVIFGETLQQRNLGHLCRGGAGADVSSAACSEVLSACCGEALLAHGGLQLPFLEQKGSLSEHGLWL